MKRWSKLLSTLLFLFSVLLYSYSARAGCDVSLLTKQNECVPATSSFLRSDNSGKTITSVTWDFGDGNTSNDTAAFVNHNYKTTGSFKVKVTVTYSDGTTCTAQLTKPIVVNALPKAVANLPTLFPYGSTQCFKRGGKLNSFHFTESSIPGSSGAPIVGYEWNFGDGDTINTQSPDHSYQAAGTYTISLRVTDSNGCVGSDFKTSSIVVLKDIATNFTKNGKIGCNSATYTFKNITDTVGLHMKSFYWDFGDGSAVDSTDYDPTHLFLPGKTVADTTYNVTLTIVNNIGCSASLTQKVEVDKFQIQATFKDTICWSDAANNGVKFIAAQQPNVVFWQWNFGDPNSQNLNIANYAWTASHKFVGGPGGAPGGPGNYQVRFLMINSNPNCGKNGQLDTCFLVHIKGPMAMINLPAPPPFPLNNFYPATKMPKSVFLAIQNNPSTCDPQTVKYSTFSKTGAPTKHWTYKYCHADTLASKVDTATDCYGKHKIPYYSSITLKPTDSSYTIYADSVETKKLWTKGIDPVPSGNTFYPSTGSTDWNDVHDSNLVTCTLPNLVRFTNNSIKYRLQIQLDDNTFNNVLDPTNTLRDTCRWKNYPMSSDSLVYFWKFNDPSGAQCTSTVSNKNWDCNFSTLAAPYHYYRGKKGYPNSRCQPVQMSVTDTVAHCSDSTTLQLKQGSPQASWDKTAYCKMTWEMQVTQLAPKGQPGPAGPPLIGFQLNNQANACTGPVYPFRIDLGQTLPTCGATNWWVTFDSLYTTHYKKCKGGTDSVKDYGFLGDPTLGYTPGKNSYPAAAPSGFWQGLPWLGNYWYETGDSGCKTIGVVLQNGKCFDTAWYHDYICFNKLEPYFNIFNVIPADTSKKATAELFVDDSKHNGHGHICQQGFNEGVRVRLYPNNPNQKDVTSFKYSIQRREFPAGAWYYTLPFWPDSATLNPFTTWNDSIRQIDYKVYYIDTPHLYIILNQPGLPPHRTVMNFPLYKYEIDSLNANKHVNVSLQDGRARRISAICGKPYVTLYVDKVVLKGSTQVLNLNGFGAVDSVVLPYPGFYTIQSVATNLQGCLEPAQYHLIYGHYATFNAQNDSIVCLGQKVCFSYYVRYWSTTCPPGPGGTPPPDGCLDGTDEGFPGDFDPWDYSNPTAYRDSLVKDWSKTKPSNYTPETMYWNFGDNPFFNKVPNGSKICHTYTKPGVYTVSMRTVDWRGCPVTTVRRNLIKVIQPVADFSVAFLKDTFNYCAPKQILLLNKTKLLGASYTDKVVKKGVLVDSTFVVDTVKALIWQPGDGRTITKTYSDSVIFDYQTNDTFTVTLTVQTNHGCGDTKTRVKYITLVGPQPKFEIVGKDSGCSPLTIVVRNHNTSNVSSNEWHLGDDTKLFPNARDTNHEDLTSLTLTTAPPNDTIVKLKYNVARGHFRLHLYQTDTFHDLTGNQLPPCHADKPDPLTDSPQVWVTVFPNSPIRLQGDRFLCINKPGTYKAVSGFGEYTSFTWDVGKQGFPKITNGDSFISITYNRTDYQNAKKDADGRAVFLVTVTGKSIHGCSKTDTFSVHVEDSHADFDVDSSQGKIAKFTFHNKSLHAVQYFWDFGDNTTYATKDSNEVIKHEYTDLNGGKDISEGKKPIQSFNVRLITISPLGCPDTLVKTVTILRDWEHYNVFTPNGDGQNDKFQLLMDGETEYSLKIFNRWGQKVFESTDSKNAWDGNDQATGLPCSEGTYYYIWHFKLIGGMDKTVNGAVTILRNK